MAGNTGQNQLVRFGPFVADLAAGELRKNGRRVPLQEQPFQVLAALLQRYGQVVTREDLRTLLWPEQPFVDFDQGLNTAINKIRDALGDSAASPRFVETLPRRGYRFSFPVDSAQPAEPPPVTVGRRVPGTRALVALAGTCILLAASCVLLWIRQPGRPVELPPRKYSVRLSLSRSLIPLNRRAVVSPDGRSIAFVSDDSRLWVQRLDMDEPYPIDGTERATGPFWSPDSQVIGFAAGGLLKRVAVAGGHIRPVATLSSILFFGGAFSPDGQTIVYGDGQPSELFEVSAAGGSPRRRVAGDSLPLVLSAAGTGHLHNPYFLPSQAGQRIIVFSSGNPNSRMLVRDLDTGRTELLGQGQFVTYSPSGHLMFQNQANPPELWAQPLSLNLMKTTGPAFRIARNGAEPSVSRDGTLVYIDATKVSARLVWLDRSGRRLAELAPPRPQLYYPAISPDGKRVAVESSDGGNLDLWVHDLERGSRLRLTTAKESDVLPVWSPDGQWIAYTSRRGGPLNIYLRRADASDDDQALTKGPGFQRVSDWSRDGRYIFFYSGVNHLGGPGSNPDRSSSLQYLQRNGAGGWEARVFLRSKDTLRVPKLSPDGKSVAYLSNETGRDELYVRSFPGGERQWAVSRNGAAQPRWSRNGRELFYVEGSVLMAVPVHARDGFSPGAPMPLFSHTGFGRWLDPNYDVSPNGERILLPEPVGGPGTDGALRVSQNWFAEFREKP